MNLKSNDMLLKSKFPLKSNRTNYDLRHNKEGKKVFVHNMLCASVMWGGCSSGGREGNLLTGTLAV